VLVGISETSPVVGFYNRSVGPPCFPPPASVTDPRCYSARWISDSPYIEHGSFESASDLDLWGVALTAKWDLGAVAVKSITAYRNMDSFFSLDNDHSPLTIVHIQSEFRSRQLSEELQLTGTGFGERLTWLFGAYYYDENAWDRNPVDFSIGSLEVGGDLDVRSRALFAQATCSLTPKLDLTLGIRYTDEEKIRDPRSFITTFLALGPGLVLPAGTFLVPPEQATVSASATTPLVNLAYKWNESLMTYLTYSEGFKGGGFTDRVASPVPAAPTFSPEYVESYEIGLKALVLDERLRLNAAAFHMNYTDIQLLVAGSIAATVQNAAEAEIQGIELEAEARPTQRLRLVAGLGYTHAEYTKVNPLATEVTLNRRLPKTPEWSANTSLSYEIPLRQYGTLVPQIDWSYRSKAFNDALNDPRIEQEGHHLLNVGLAFEPPGAAWHFALSGKNLTNEKYILNGKSNPIQGIATAIFNRGAEWGLVIERRF
jgi:iron complex outermembrane receptor protein